MNNSLKFRVWDKINKKWACIYNLLLLREEENKYYFISNFENRFVFNRNTELVDKTGREIYEGDILLFNNLREECEEENIIGEIKYISGGFKFLYLVRGLKEYMDLGQYLDLNNKLSDFQIIGNTFENADLIK